MDKQTDGPLAGHYPDGLGHSNPAAECRCTSERTEGSMNPQEALETVTVAFGDLEGLADAVGDGRIDNYPRIDEAFEVLAGLVKASQRED